MVTVYLLQAGDTDHYKIGITSGQARGRKSALQTGNPLPLRICFWIQLWDEHQAREVERKVLDFVGDFRKNGEWFEWPRNQVWPTLRDEHAYGDPESMVFTWAARACDGNFIDSFDHRAEV